MGGGLRVGGLMGGGLRVGGLMGGGLRVGGLPGMNPLKENRVRRVLSSQNIERKLAIQTHLYQGQSECHL